MSKTKEATIIGQQIITDAAMHMRKTQYAIKAEQDGLLKEIKLQQENDGEGVNFDTLITKILAQIEFELESAQQLSSAIKFNNEQKCYAHFGIRFNKLQDALKGAQEITNELNLSAILKGNCPKQFDNSIDESLPILGGQQFWGTSKPTFLTTLLAVTWNTLSGGNISANENSAIFHTFNCPKDFTSDSVTSSLFINKAEGVEVTIPHSGYSFGGDRMCQKVFRPQDCTSFLEMSAQLTPNGASTADLYLAKRQILKQGLVVVDDSWLDSAGGSMVKLFDVNEKSPNPGDIYAVRKFNDTKPIGSSLGCDGHAGIYLGEDNGKTITLTYNRDMPKIEGFGMESRENEANSSQRDQFFLTRNDKAFENSSDFYPYNNLDDLPRLINYIDSKILPESGDLGVSGDVEENTDF